jgi:hypothetical protein
MNVIDTSRNGKKMGKMTQEMRSQKRKGRVQMWTEHERWHNHIEN